MSQTSANNRRIAKNTALLYVRMLFKTLVTFYTSRVILEVLGVDDFGIYNVVAGIVALFAFVNSSMAISVQRYLSYEIGRGEKNGSQSTIYSMSVLIHALIAVCLIVLSEIAGYVLFKHYLNVPSDRLDAAYVLFHWSVLTCAMSFIQVPYISLLISYEKMNAYAYVGILEVVLRLAAVYILTWCSFDRLPFYGVLLFGVSVLVTLLYASCCRVQVREVRFKRVWDAKVFRNLFSFALWSALGEMAWAGTGQGVNILLNVFFNPVVNAARAIAVQVIAGLNQFVMSFQTAVNPQIIKSYAAGDNRRMTTLANKCIVYSYYLLMMLCLPVILNMDYILRLWLKTPPAYCVSFCTMSIVGAMTDCLSNLLATVAKAYGKIRNYQLVVSAVLFLNFPLSYVVLKLGASPVSVYVVYVGVSLLLLCLRLWLLHRMVRYNARLYLRTVLLRIVSVTLVAIPIAYVIRQQMNDSWQTLIVSSSLSVLTVSIVVYVIGMTKVERTMVNDKLKILIQRCKN